MRIVVSLIAAVAAFEYLSLVGMDDLRGRTLFVAMTGLTAWQLSIGVGVGAVAIAAVFFILGLLAVLMHRTTVHQTILSGFALVYIGMPLGLVANVNITHGWRSTVLLIATVAVSDSLQYYSGRAFGRRLLAPAISPKKTVEGAIGGVIAGTLFVVFAGPYVFPATGPAVLALLGFSMVLLGILGDLFESRLKREAHVKDSSALIPGHGGVLDRIDALLFVIPVFAGFAGAVR
jgi:phosphatidate cytidylyltransferase